MLTLKQIVSNFAEKLDAQHSIDELTSFLESNQITASSLAGKSNFVKMQAIAKTISINAKMADFESSIWDQFELLRELPEMDLTMSELDKATLMTKCVLNTLWPNWMNDVNSMPENSTIKKTYVLSNVRGYPVYGHIWFHLMTRRQVPVQYYSNMYFWINQNEEIGDHPTMGELSAMNCGWNNDNPSSLLYTWNHFTDENCAMTFTLTPGVVFDNLMSDIAEGLATNSCFSDIILTLGIDGDISIDRINGIFSRYGETYGIRLLKDKIAGLSSISGTSLIAIIGDIYAKSSGSYEDDDDHWTPYSTPEYDRNILATVFALLATVVATVLSIVFKAIAAVVAAVLSIIGTVWGVIGQKVTQTSASVVRPSLSPVWNYPFFTTSKYTLEDWVQLAFDPHAITDWTTEVLRAWEDYGCCALAMGITGQPAKYYVMLIPNGEVHLDGKHPITLQILISCISTYSDVSHNAGLGSGLRVVKQETTPPGDYVALINAPGTWLGSSPLPCDEATYPYIFYSPKQHARSFLEGMLAVASLFADTAIYDWYDASDFSSGKDSNIQIDLMLANVKTWVQTNHYNAYQALSCLCYAYTAMMEYVPMGDSVMGEQSFDSLRNIADYISECMISIEADISDDPDLQTWPGVNAFANQSILPIQTCFDARSILNPSVEFPKVSLGGVIGALLISAVTGAVLAFVSYKVSHLAKSRAVKNLGLKESEFENAKKEYVANPTKVNQEKLYKANKRLTRAWKRAGRVGVTTYNGFATTSDTSTVSSDVADNSGNFLTDLLSANNMTVEKSSDMSNDGFALLKALITGSL